MDNSQLPMAIVQNKLDKINELDYKQTYWSIDYLKDFAEKNKFCCYFQTSAKTGENIDFAFSSFLKIVIDKYESYLDKYCKHYDDPNTDCLKLENQKTKYKTRNCC